MEIHTLTTAFDVKYKPSYRICKWLSNKAFNIQDNTGKVRHTSIQHLQLLHLNDQVPIQLRDMTMFGQTTKYINYPKAMPNLHMMEISEKPNDN